MSYPRSLATLVLCLTLAAPPTAALAPESAAAPAESAGLLGDGGLPATHGSLAPPSEDALPLAFGLFASLGVWAEASLPGQAAVAVLSLEALEPVEALRLELEPTDGLSVAGALPATQLAEGDTLEVPLLFTPGALGDFAINGTLHAVVRGTPVERLLDLVVHVDDDPSLSQFIGGLLPLVPGPSPMAAGSPQATFSANRVQPVVLLNGFDPVSDSLFDSETGKRVDAEWRQYLTALQGWGWSGPLGGVAMGECDQDFQPGWNIEQHGKPNAGDIHQYSLGSRSQDDNHHQISTCDSACFDPLGVGMCPFTVGGRPAVGTHDQDTGIEHLAYHWAWTVRDLFGTQCVNAVGHSMGALVIRYALWRVDVQDSDFPADLCVDDVVSIAGPHGGADQNVWAGRCADFDFGYQCDQQLSGSTFLNTLNANAPNPQGAGGTDWTNLGSDQLEGGDTSVSASSATNGFMDPAHSVVYQEPIAHSTHSADDASGRHWKNAVAQDITANIQWTDEALGFQATTANGPWPARHTDLSMAYTQWGCGPAILGSTWPLGPGVTTVGEPYTTSYDCWYHFNVPSGQTQLQVTMSSLGGHDMNLFLRKASLTATPACSQTSSASSHTCTVSNPGSGLWYVQVQNAASTRNPFTVQATYQLDDLTSTSMTSYPSVLTTGQSYTACWSVSGVGSITHTQVHWGTSISSQPNSSPVQTGTAPNTFCATLNAPSTPGSLYLRSHAMGPNDDLLSTIIGGIPVLAPQDDCGTGSDAGNSFSLASSITLPKSACPGNLVLPGDTEDWFQFSATSGHTVSLGLTPAAGTDFQLCLYTPSNGVASCSSNTGSAAESVTYVATSTGAWRARLYVASGSGSYTFSASTTAPQNDCGTGGDAGNTHSTGASIAPPVNNCQAVLTTSDTMDFFRFTANAGDQIAASITPSSGSNFDLCLNNPSGSTIVCSSNTGSATDSASYTATTGGTWSVNAYVATGSGGGSYTLSASVTPPPPNDCGTGADAGGSHATATLVTLPKNNCQGGLSSSDTQDWYKFTVASGAALSLSMTPSSGANFDLCLYTPSSSTAVQCSTLTGSSTDSVSYTATSSGDWRARVNVVSGGGTYTFSASAVAPQNDCGTGGDAGGTHSTGASITLPKSGCTGALTSTDTMDFFRFTVNLGDVISASMTPPSGSNFDLCLNNPSGSTIVCSSNTGSVTDSISYTANTAGTWSVNAYLASGSAGGTYSLSVSAAPPPQNDCGTGADAGGSHATASTIGLPKNSCSGSLPLGDTQDWYQFTATSGDTISLSMTPPSGSDFNLCLYTPSGTQVQCSTLGGSSTESISYSASVTGSWRAQVYSSSGTGGYTFSASAVTPQNDCGTGGDAGGTHSTAASITPPVSGCTALLTASDQMDFFKFYANTGDQISASITPPSGSNFDLCLNTPSGSTVNPCSANIGSSMESISYAATASGYWSVDAYVATGSLGGTYSLSVSIVPGQNDCGTGADAGGSFGAAAWIGLPQSNCSGSLSSSDTHDWYRFSSNNGETITVSVTPPSGSDFDICLYNPSGTQVQCAAAGGSATDTIVYTSNAAGEWRADVYLYSGGGTYSFSASSSQNDCGTGADAGGNFNSAALITLPKSNCQGSHPASWDDMDWYQFHVNSGETISTSMTPASGANFDMCLNTPSGATIACSSNGGSATDSIVYTATSSGYWRLDTYISSGTGSYTLSVSKS